METINERIQYIIDQYFKGNSSSFCKEAGINPKTIHAIVSSKLNKPNTTTIQKILSIKIVNINPDWLMTGTGEVLKSNPKDYEVNEKLSIVKDNKIRSYSCLACIEKEKRIEALCEALRSKTETIECLRENIDLLKGKSSLTGAAS